MAKQATTKRNRHGLLVFSEPPGLPLAGSRFVCLHTSLGCKPKSLKRVSVGWYSRTVKKGDPIPAYSPVSLQRRLTALVEIDWARRVQEPMPKLADPTYKRTAQS
jgi:hypothetical protein